MMSSTDLHDVQFSAPGRVVLSQIRLPNITLIRFSSPSVDFVWRRRREEGRRRRVFVLMKSGKTVLACNGESVEVPALRSAMIDTGGAEVQFSLKGAPAEYIILSIRDSQLFETPVGQGQALQLFQSENAVLGPTVFNLLSGIISALPKDYEENDAALISSLILSTGNTLSGLRLKSGTDSGGLFQTAMNHLDLSHKQQRLTIEKLASQLGVSSRTLQKHFAAEGTSVAVELRRRRVQTALEILKDHPALSMPAVAAASGFSTSQVMRTSIASITGKTPRELRSKESAG